MEEDARVPLKTLSDQSKNRWGHQAIAHAKQGGGMVGWEEVQMGSELRSVCQRLFSFAEDPGTDD